MKHIVLAITVALASTASALAATPYEADAVCPVGGKKFKYTSTMSWSTWGERPDGKPYGSWIFPSPLPECPENKLVMYREFSPAEIEQLTALVTSADYRALSQETQRGRAVWLERRLDPNSADIPWMLLAASWEADGDPALKARYQREFILAADGLTPDDKFRAAVLQYRVANAERETGAFDKAAARLAAIPEASLKDGNGPALAQMIKRLGSAIARRDSSSEPLDVLSPRIAAGICADMDEAQARERDPSGLCKSPDIAREVKELRDLRVR